VDPGDLLTRWTIRLALLCLATVLGWRLAGRPGVSPTWPRLVWAAGCALSLAHVACAFHFVHHWDHPAAYEATARRVEEWFGVRYGAGLYWNYAFAAVWLADAVWWCGWPARHERRPRWVGWAVDGFLAFMAVNGAVVFATGAVRWAGVAVCCALALVWLARRGSRS
jgi:hypothetical protein